MGKTSIISGSPIVDRLESHPDSGHGMACQQRDCVFLCQFVNFSRDKLPKSDMQVGWHAKSSKWKQK
jgi:hypothetical protein